MARNKLICGCRGLAITGFLLGAIAFSSGNAQTVTPPAPYGLTPSKVQIEFFHRERMVFLHFGMNTFTGAEWGSGTENPNTFNPTALDCNQWCRTIKKAGFTTAILTCKHHDGFCLWPTATNNRNIKNSSWKNGQGDVVKEFTDACKAAGIKAGVYLSPWDRYMEQPGAAYPFGQPAYLTYYANQCAELMKNYGTIWHLWWDGAMAEPVVPEGYQRWADTTRKYQPQCAIFGTRHGYLVGDVRWCGNESGIGGDPCWSTVMKSAISEETGSALNSGDLNGDVYRPAETQTSIRPGWFYHSSETPKSVTAIWDYWFNSAGRNSVMHLNIPPDTRGLLPAADSANIWGFYRYLYGTFRKNLLAGATATALHTRGPGYDPKNMLDSCENTYFAATDAANTDTIVFTSPSAITFDVIMIQEVIELGHRTLNWSVDAYSNNTWTTISVANNKQCIGYKRAVKWSPATTATQVRLRITGGRACPAIHTFGVYKQDQVDPPVDWQGPVKACDESKVAPADRPTQKVAPRTLRITGKMIELPAGFGAGPVTVAFFDMQGHCVKTMVAGKTGSEQRIFLPSLGSGLYMVKVCNGTRTLTQKFMAPR